MSRVNVPNFDISINQLILQRKSTFTSHGGGSVRESENMRKYWRCRRCHYRCQATAKAFQIEIELCCYLSFILGRCVCRVIHVCSPCRTSHHVTPPQWRSEHTKKPEREKEQKEEKKSTHEQNGNRACAAHSCINGHLIKLPVIVGKSECLHIYSVHISHTFPLHVCFHAPRGERASERLSDTCVNRMKKTSKRLLCSTQRNKHTTTFDRNILFG